MLFPILYVITQEWFLNVAFLVAGARSLLKEHCLITKPLLDKFFDFSANYN